MTTLDAPRLVKIKELRKSIPMSARKIQTLYRDHGFPHVRCGRNVLFDVAEAIEWLKSNQDAVNQSH